MRSSSAILLQQCGHYRWGGQYNDDWLVHIIAQVNEYFVMANERVDLYKIFVLFEAFAQESTLLFANTPLVWALSPLHRPHYCVI